MGYITKDIAQITEPKRVSLSSLPNFVQFKSKPGAKTYLEANIAIVNRNTINPLAIQNLLAAYPPDGSLQPHVFYGVTEPIEIESGGVYTLLNNNVVKSEPIGIFYFTEDMVIVSFLFAANSSSIVMNAPNGAKYVRLDIEGPATGAEFSNYGLFAGLNPVFKPGQNELSTVLRFTEPSGVVHEFSGSTTPENVGGSVYYMSPDPANTAENLRQALLADRWVSANFEVRIAPVWAGNSAVNGRELNVKSKGAGEEFEVDIAAPNDPDQDIYALSWVQNTSNNNDSISGEASTVEISLDVYTDAPIFLGADDRPTTSALLGNFALTLSKTYSGGTLWFDVNGPFAKSTGFNLPPEIPGWFNTGTMRVYRFVARVAGIDNFTFYMSNALYVLRGYGKLSDPVDMEDFVYIGEQIKLLTNKPRTIYVKGQREYLNFILDDGEHGLPYAENWSVYILYRAYDTLGNFIGQVQSDTINRSALNMVNTCVLRIDDLLTAYPTAGLVRVSLARDGAIISSDLEYMVRPSSLHTLRQFSFINKLGGWDSFNFDAGVTEEVKVTFETFTKTVTPSHRKGDGVETVYAADLDDTLSITGAPVTDEVAEWLKEFAASTVVLDSDGRYVIKSEFATPISENAKNMQVPTMKYRTSETYTNE